MRVRVCGCEGRVCENGRLHACLCSTLGLLLPVKVPID